MKYLIPIFALAFLAQSCLKDECSNTYTFLVYEPVFKSAKEIGADIKFEKSRSLKKAGKIYYYNKYLLISEVGLGIHIFDNSDFTKPKNLGFLVIDGNIDIAMKNNFIYADTKYNIVIIDISKIEEPQVVNVLNEVKNDQIQIENGKFIVDYQLTESKEEISCSEYTGPIFYRGNVLYVDKTSTSNLQSGSIPEFDVNGQGGSLARMALFNGYFYYVNSTTMHIFDAKELAAPKSLGSVSLDWGVETIFPYEDKLFIGANNGMHIFDNSNPAKPKFLSTFAHARACDPVAVEGTTAYVTLRDGRECESFSNQLDVIDISDLLNPTLIASYKMTRPEGLAVRDNILFICEGKDGLKVFDVKKKEEIDKNFLGGVKDYYARDVISVSKDLLLMVGENGFYQFQATDPAKLKLLSAIQVSN